MCELSADSRSVCLLTDCAGMTWKTNTYGGGVSPIFEPGGTEQRQHFLQCAGRTDRSVCCATGKNLSDPTELFKQNFL